MCINIILLCCYAYFTNECDHLKEKTLYLPFSAGMPTSPFFSVVQGFLNGTAEVSTVREATTQREMCLLFTTFKLHLIL